ncbi:hypothetical protein HDU92_003219 [Lobulomyces angularis]|nr:hypothetical protein HDU92_003219 [Lobulomyces angularis]
MIIDEEAAATLKENLTSKLEPICDADPSVLAEYAIALLRHEKSISELKILCLNQLEDFLKHETENFVKELFQLLESDDNFNSSIRNNEDQNTLTIKAEEEDSKSSNNSRRASSPLGESRDREDDRFINENNRERDKDRKRKSHDDYVHSQKKSRNNTESSNGNQGSMNYNAGNKSGYRGNERGNFNSQKSQQHYNKQQQQQFFHQQQMQQQQIQQNFGNFPNQMGFHTTWNQNQVSRGMAVRSFMPNINPFQQMHGRPVTAGAGRQQRCRDYDEKGFCLRGDLCPYDHGADRIVVDNNPMMMGNVSFGMQGNQAAPKLAINAFGGTRTTLPLPGSYDPEAAGRPSLPTVSTMSNILGSNSSMQLTEKFKKKKNTQPPHLVIEKIPLPFCTLGKIHEYFKQFGQVKNIHLTPSMHRAIIEYQQLSEAQSCYNSPVAIFGNRFVKVYWYREEHSDISVSLAPTISLYPKGQEPTFEVTPEVKCPPDTKSITTTSSKPLNTEEKKKFELQEAQKKIAEQQKQQTLLLEKHLENQKFMLNQLKNSKNLTTSEKEEIKKKLAEFTNLSSEMLSSSFSETTTFAGNIKNLGKSKEELEKLKLEKETKTKLDRELENMVIDKGHNSNAENESADPALVAALDSLKKQAINLGMNPDVITSANNPTVTNTYSHFRGRGRGIHHRGRGTSFWRGGRGGIAVSPRSFKLDNRPAILFVKGAPFNSLEALKTHFEKFGNVEKIQFEGDILVVHFKDKKSAVLAMRLGRKFQDILLFLSWTRSFVEPVQGKMASGTTESEENNLEENLKNSDEGNDEEYDDEEEGRGWKH